MTYPLRSACLMTLIIASICDQVYCIGEICLTVEGTSGNCITVRTCKYAMNIIKGTGISSEESMKFLHQNKCGFEGLDQKVCCPQDKDAVEKEKPFQQDGNEIQGSNGNSEQVDTNPISLLPTKCGALYVANRIIGGEKTELGEFPWMALLEYFEVGKGIITACGGALISKRYVLTAAHCIRSAPSTWRLTSVRLGEYDIRTDPDCIQEGNSLKSCADPIVSVPIERVIVHEGFMTPARFRNDIALLRLAYDVQDTQYIQPICLPSTNELSQMYWLAGWGQTTNDATENSDIKLKVSLPYVDLNQCAATFRTKGAVLGDGQMCAGGRAGKDNCKGDSGGPLMHQVQDTNGISHWVVAGIVSVGNSPCGSPGWPGVYTKVYDYVPWILNNLRP